MSTLYHADSSGCKNESKEKKRTNWTSCIFLSKFLFPSTFPRFTWRYLIIRCHRLLGLYPVVTARLAQILGVRDIWTHFMGGQLTTLLYTRLFSATYHPEQEILLRSIRAVPLVACSRPQTFKWWYVLDRHVRLASVDLRKHFSNVYTWP